ncbi:MAG TPA: hypothetical protein VF374_04370 [Thermoplasmata archaeon]|jgi:hypothetical protein
MRLSPVVASAVALSMFLSVLCFVPYPGSAQPGAILVPPSSEHVVDSDTDGLYDQLVIEITTEVYEAGEYLVEVGLNDSSGQLIRGKGTGGIMSIGTHVTAITFQGIWIWEHGVDGPYVIDAKLSSGPWPWTLIDQFIDSTEPYTYDQFDPLPAVIDSVSDASGLDVDGNGRYEFLVADASFEVFEENDYTIWCGLLKNTGSSLIYIRDYEEIVLHLVVGLHPMSFSIRGSYINAAEHDGPYYVVIILFDYESSLRRTLDDTWYTTYPFDYEDFEAGSFTSSLSTSAPVIDGTYGEGEWTDATLVDLGRPDMENPFGAAMLVKNNLTHLQVCLDVVTDLTEDMGDCAAVSFDTDNDNVAIDGREDQFLVGSSFVGQTVHLVYSAADTDWVIHCGPFDPTMPSHDGLAAASGFGPSPSLVDDHRIYEFAVPLELIGAVPGTVIGFAVSSDLVHGVFDETRNNGSSWPYFMEPGSPLTDFGDLTIDWPLVETVASLSGTLGNAGWYVSNVNVTLTATGGELGVDRTMYELDDVSWEEYDSPIECAEDGNHVLNYRSYDLGGNSEPIQSLEFKTDLTAPNTNTLLSGWNVTLSAADLTSGVQKTSCRVDDGPWLNYTGPVQLSRDENHTVEYYSIDFAGNVEETMTLEVEKEAVEDEDDDGQGGGGLGFLSWDFFIVLAIIALIAIIAIPKLFGMTRKAKESDAKAARKDIGTAMMQMADDTTPKKEEPPKPPQGR